MLVDTPRTSYFRSFIIWAAIFATGFSLGYVTSYTYNQGPDPRLIEIESWTLGQLMQVRGLLKYPDCESEMWAEHLEVSLAAVAKGEDLLLERAAELDIEFERFWVEAANDSVRKAKLRSDNNTNDYDVPCLENMPYLTDPLTGAQYHD